jgi:hypothetical protein
VGAAYAQPPPGGRIDTEAKVSQQKSEYRDATPVLLLKHTDTTLATYSEGYIQIKNENAYTWPNSPTSYSLVHSFSPEGSRSLNLAKRLSIAVLR